MEQADQSLTVLVADDDDLIRRALTRLLSGRGHIVHNAHDAATAIAMLEEHVFDVALVDRRMPGGGASVLHALGRHPAFAGRAILMTGTIGAEASSEVGTDVRLVTKPFSFKAMVEMVEGASP
jgi:CheY-like chemotaxis protein